MDATVSIQELRTAPDHARATTLALGVLLAVFVVASFLLGPSNLSPGELFSGLLLSLIHI